MKEEDKERVRESEKESEDQEEEKERKEKEIGDGQQHDINRSDCQFQTPMKGSVLTDRENSTSESPDTQTQWLRVTGYV